MLMLRRGTMKRFRFVLSLTVLFLVFGAVGLTQSSYADPGDQCDCYYVQSGSRGVQRWWYGVWTCHVEDCWLPLQ